MDEKTRLLVSLGASVSANCVRHAARKLSARVMATKIVQTSGHSGKEISIHQ